MDAPTGDGLIVAGASAVNTAGDFLSNAIFGKRNERWAREDATTAYNRQRQLLAEQRAYESPAAQMQRYIEAGLHPGLIYGQQQGSIAPPSVPQASTANVAPPTMSLDASGIINARLAEAQIRRLDTQNENDTDMTKGQLERWAKENDVSVAQAENYVSLTKKANAEYSKVFKEMALLDQDILDKIYENAFKRETYDERVKATMAEYGMTQEKAKKFQDILSASLADTWASANLKSKQAWQIEQLTPEELNLKKAMTSFYEAQKNGAVTQNEILKLDKALKAYYGDALTVADIMSKGGKAFQGFMYWANGLDDAGKLRDRRLENQ